MHGNHCVYRWITPYYDCNILATFQALKLGAACLKISRARITLINPFYRYSVQRNIMLKFQEVSTTTAKATAKKSLSVQTDHDKLIHNTKAKLLPFSNYSIAVLNNVLIAMPPIKIQLCMLV